MPVPVRPSRPALLIMLTVLACALAACGAGGEPAAEPPAARPTQIAAASPPSVAAPGATATELSGRGASERAPEILAPTTESRAVMLGLPERPTAAAPWADAVPDGRRFHIDSRLGQDQNDGLAPDRAWRSLSRLTSAALRAGDRVVLACGSSWRETLRLPADGSSQRPLVVAAEPGCAQPPAIDGSIELDAMQWRATEGGRARLPLAQAPLAIGSATDAWVVAHHPNRGPAGPRWLSLAADGNLTQVDGREVSTELTVGADLVPGPGQVLGAGSRVRVRTAAYVVDDLPVASLNGRQLRLAAPSTYPVKAGWGYLLTGQAWMVDSPGEWHHDAATGWLTVQPAGDAAQPRWPTHATVLPTGIDLQGRSHVVVEGLVLRRLGQGALLRGASSVRLRNLVVEDIADRGVDAAASRDVVVESSLLQRTGADAVFAGGIAAEPAQGLVVRDNVIRESGVRLSASGVSSLPRRSYGAILAGREAVVTGNTLVDTAYIGIRVFERSRVERNTLVRTCTTLDDCGAIYTQGAANGGRIAGNIVWQVLGNPEGKPAAARAPQAQGLYLDDDAEGVTVEDNTVIDADHGLQLHDAARNTLRANRLVANRVAGLWLQQTRRAADGAGTVRGNSVEANQFAPVHALARSLLIESSLPGAPAPGGFDLNRYLDARPGRIGTLSSADGWRDFDLAAWWANPGLAATSAPDPRGSASSGDGYASHSVAGANLVANGDFSAGLGGWSHWNAGATPSQARADRCAGQRCLRFVAGSGAGVLSSPNFSLEAGRWYRLTLDVATDAPQRRLQWVVRRGGGGNNGYESLADRDLAVTAGPALQRHVLLFQARAGVRAQDPVTGDLGARVDLEGLPPGAAVDVARVELVPVTPYGASRALLALVNASDAPIDAGCPLADAQAAQCLALADLADRTAQRVRWPLRLPPRSAVVLRGFEPALPDADGDGIPDWQDACAGTPARTAVDARGCALGQ